jgi:hypothetical protein
MNPNRQVPITLLVFAVVLALIALEIVWYRP